MTTTATTAATTAPSLAAEMTSPAEPTLAEVRKALARRSYCTLASVSARGRPHVAGVVYSRVGDELWTNTLRSSRKARNIAGNEHVHLMVPVRRIPFGPPMSVQFAATARLLAHDDPEVVRLAATGALRAITSHGELALPDSVFVKITPGPVWHTFGLGLSLWALMKDPINAAGRVTVDDAA